MVKSLDLERLNRNIVYWVTILNYNIDITSEIEDLKIEFSLSSMPFGSFILRDVDYNVFERYPLMGGEDISITVFHELSDNAIFMKVFKISHFERISNDAVLGNNENAYKIHFVSQYTFINALNKISRGYPGTFTSAEIVKDIFERDFFMNDEVGYRIINSHTIMDNYILTWNNPFEHINYLKTISRHQYNHDFYLFYEDFMRLNFVPLSMLMSRLPETKLQRVISTDMETEGIPLLKVNKTKFITGINILSSIEQSHLAKTVLYFNDEDKTNEEFVLNFNEDFFNDSPTLGEISYYEKSLCENSLKSDYELDGLFSSPSKYHKASYVIRKSLLNIFNLKVEINGTFDLNLGDVIYLEFLKNNDELNPLLTGSWLIKQIRFFINSKDKVLNKIGVPQFKTELILAKDAYGMTNKQIKQQIQMIESDTNVNNPVIKRVF